MATANSTSSFKLSYHKGSGQFCKVLKGKRWYLGTDHDKALETWFKYKADFEAGVDPRKDKSGTTRYLNVRDGCNLFLDKRKEEVAEATWTSLRFQCKQIVNFFGPNTLFSSLTPDHFAALKAHLDTGNPVSLGNKIIRVKTICHWLADRDYIDKPKFGIDFKTPDKKAIRKHRSEQAERVLSPEEFRKIANELGVMHRACAYLGLNCGFGPTDCYELPTSVVDLDGAIIRWTRVKTGQDRVCPLWRETVDALDLWDRCRGEDGTDRFFELARADDVTRGFTAGVKAAKRQRKGLSFYALRHTLGTIGRGANDDAALKLVMGHVDDSMLNEHYTHRFPRERLDAVSEHVRRWLFGGGKPR